jgi:hypothetical protein
MPVYTPSSSLEILALQVSEVGDVRVGQLAQQMAVEVGALRRAIASLSSGAGGSSYTHFQAVAAAVWTVNHNLGFLPSVVVVDSIGELVEGDVLYVDLNQLVLQFSAPFSGTARFS